MVKFLGYNLGDDEDFDILEDTLPFNEDGIDFPAYESSDEDGHMDEIIFVAAFQVYTEGAFPSAYAIQHAKGLTIEVESLADEDLVAVLEWPMKDAPRVLVQLHERMDLMELLVLPGMTLSKRGECTACREEQENGGCDCKECTCVDEEEAKCECASCRDDDSDPTPDPVN